MSTTNNPLPKSHKEANFRAWLSEVETSICNTSTQHPTAMAGAVLGDEHLARIYQGGPTPSTTTYPLNPGNPPVKPVQKLNTTDEAFLKEMKNYRLLLGDYTTESKAYTEHLATIASIKDDIVNTLHDTDRTELSHPHSGMRLVTTRQIMDHMWGKYGRLTATDMAKLREDTKTIYTPGTDMSDFIANLNRKYTELAMNSEPVNESTKAPTKKSGASRYQQNSISSSPEATTQSCAQSTHAISPPAEKSSTTTPRSGRRPLPTAPGNTA
jgi:hypothetical protein